MPVIGILDLVDSGLKLGQSIVDRMNLKDRQKYIDNVHSARLALMNEDGKPDGERSDRLVEDLTANLQLEVQTMNEAIAAGVTESK